MNEFDMLINAVVDAECAYRMYKGPSPIEHGSLGERTWEARFALLKAIEKLKTKHTANSDKLSMQDIRDMGDFASRMREISTDVAYRYNLVNKLEDWKDSGDISKILYVMDHCLWLGFCERYDK